MTISPETDDRNEKSQDNRSPQDGIPRPHGHLRKPHPARLRHRHRPQLDFGRCPQAGGPLRLRLGIDAPVRGRPRRRPRQLLRRMDAQPPERHDLLQRRIPAGEFLFGGGGVRSHEGLTSPRHGLYYEGCRNIGQCNTFRSSRES